MKPIIVKYRLDCGHGIIRNMQDIVINVPSITQAKKVFGKFLKDSLPAYQKVLDCKFK